ncbi:hypothetical protein ACJX0J_015130, partial [Zea mays]
MKSHNLLLVLFSYLTANVEISILNSPDLLVLEVCCILYYFYNSGHSEAVMRVRIKEENFKIENVILDIPKVRSEM